MAAVGPSISEIVRRNWTLDEFIREGYLENGDISPGLVFSGDDPNILRGWAEEIDLRVRDLYEQLGWDTFKEDLLYVFYNEGRLLTVDDYKATAWFRDDEGGGYYLFIAIRDQGFSLLHMEDFEDVFLNVISLEGGRLEVYIPNPLPNDVYNAYEQIYNDRMKETNELFNSLMNRNSIYVYGYPMELGITPIVNMIDGYIFANSNEEIIIIGRVITSEGESGLADAYNYSDGQRILSVLTINRDKWEIVKI